MGQQFTEEEIRALDEFRPEDHRFGTKISYTPVMRSLKEKGCFEVSPVLHGRAWNGGEIGWIDEGTFAARLTDYGAGVLLDAEKKRHAKITQRFVAAKARKARAEAKAAAVTRKRRK